MRDLEDEEVGCHHSGRCVAPHDAKLIDSCVYCGKELHEKDGDWWTWDADQHPNPQPQWKQAAPAPSALSSKEGLANG